MFTVLCEPYLLDEYGDLSVAPVTLQSAYMHDTKDQDEHEVRLPALHAPKHGGCSRPCSTSRLGRWAPCAASWRGLLTRSHAAGGHSEQAAERA